MTVASQPIEPGMEESSCNLQHGCRRTEECHCRCVTKEVIFSNL